MRLDNTLGIRSSGWWTRAFGSAFLLFGTQCAVYDDGLLAPVAAAGAGDVTSAGPLSADNGSLGSHPPILVEQGGTAGVLPAEGSSRAVGGVVNVPAGQGVAGTAGVGGAALPSDSGGGTSGGSTNGGSGGSGEYGGSTNGGNTAGSGGSTNGDSAVTSESWNDNNLSRGKPARADSEQISRQHYASDANDGDRSSRWCAADYRLNHYWEVDLGESFSLSTLRILWEKDAGYLFKVESSVDHASWSLVLDKTESNSANANQQHSFVPGAKGRYVRITVTGGLSFTTWASFQELDIFGH